MSSLDQYRTRIEEYSEKYAEFMKFERDELGVLTVYLHTKGGASLWNNFNHRALGQSWADIGRDPENQVVILTGTDGQWIAPEGGKWTGGWDLLWTAYAGQLRFFESFVHNIEVPTIGALSSPGPSIHLEPALACDLTICSDVTRFGDFHYYNHAGAGMGNPAGDGTGLAIEELIGRKRAAYLVYLGKTIDAQTALDWGMVNEVLPVDQLVSRAQELGREIVNAAPVGARRLQSQMFKREWKKRLADDWAFHLSHELLSLALNEDHYGPRMGGYKNKNEPVPR
jgi:Enoyl-CoA hydratase/carnithine racemase